MPTRRSSRRTTPTSAPRRRCCPFCGAGIERYIGYGSAIGREGDAAGLLDVSKERATLERGDKAIQLKKSVTYFSVTPEVGCNAQLYWYPWEGVQIKAGYNF